MSPSILPVHLVAVITVPKCPFPSVPTATGESANHAVLVFFRGQPA